MVMAMGFVRMMHVAIMVPVLGIAIVCAVVGMLGHLVHRVYFTHVGRLAQPEGINVKSPQAEGLCYQWEV